MKDLFKLFNAMDNISKSLVLIALKPWPAKWQFGRKIVVVIVYIDEITILSSKFCKETTSGLA